MTNLSESRTLGRSGLKVGPLGVAASYGAPTRAFELAFEHGCNFFYWGSFRTDAMGEAIRNLAPRNRDRLVVALQSYSRIASLIPGSVNKALKKLKLDHADVLILGWYNRFPSERVIETALNLKEKGRIRAIAVSGHNRPLFRRFIEDPRFDIIMARYNAAHRGAEQEIFPYLDGHPNRPGVMTYTSTRWGQLIDPRLTPPGHRTPTAADCYRFALSNPHVDLCFTGPATTEQMKANLEALRKGPLSPEELTWMRTVGDYIHGMSALGQARLKLIDKATKGRNLTHG